MTNLNSKVSWTIFGIFLVLVLGTTGYFYFNQNSNLLDHFVSTTSSLSPSTSTTSTTTAKSEPAIIYSEQISHTEGPGRSYPTVAIKRKIGNADPQTLATVGKVNEFPNRFVLSPDKKSLLINLESKLQILNLSTLELKDSFVSPKNTIDSVIYSHDGKELLIWDFTSTNYDYDLHRFNLSTNKDTIIKQGTGLYSLINWVDNKNVVLQIPMGEGADIAHYDLSTNEITKNGSSKANGFGMGWISPLGQLNAVSNFVLDDKCNEMIGSANSSYTIKNSITDAELGTIGDNKTELLLKAFSPNEKEFLYYSKPARTSSDNCSFDNRPITYYKYFLSTKKSEIVDDYVSLLKTWNNEYIGVDLLSSVSNDAKTTVYTLMLGKTQILQSDKSVELIAQYYN